MGVPALFRWLSRKYPKIISPVVEEEDHEIGGAKYENPNPNGEIDNLYLDMNGIVHPCSHPEHKKPPETEDEMFLDIFKYTDRVLMMARPRKVLMIAVDGVAPRAKMNQQRARRFRAAKDAELKAKQLEIEVQERELRGEIINDAIKGKKQWDSNAITPGTPFMDRLAEALRYWVAYKLSSDPGWANLQVIISDATVPGEGEHKLMSFIRLQRSDPQYDPNTKHCIYGLDADLIFLGLATHEPHFRVLREDVFASQDKKFTIKDQIADANSNGDTVAKEDKKPFLWLHVNVLREYLQVELFTPRMSFPFELERAIDDWVFLCFFAGNDFLPHLPSLDVRDNGIDTLVQCWKRSLPILKDYVTCDGKLNLKSVEVLMSNLAYKESEIFKNKHAAEQRREENNKRRKLAQEQERALKRVYLSQVSKGKDKAPLTADVNMPLMDTLGQNVEGYANLTNSDIVQNRAILTKANLANSDAAAELKKLIDSKKTQVTVVQDQIATDSSANSETTTSESELEEIQSDNSLKRKLEPEEDKQTQSDDIKLWEPGYNKRYYEAKFHCQSDEEIEQTKRDVVRHYVEGIAWVALYYYQGCPSWNWYFPYHYAPFAADFTNLEELFPEGVKFKLGEPFRPFEQLMSVLPAASGHTLPQVFRDLMSNPDSEIIDLFYMRSEQAIIELSVKYGNVCNKVAKNILNNILDAEECVNDAYLGAWNTIPPQNPNPLLTYICRIVRNLSIKKYHANTSVKRNSFYDAALDELEECVSSSESVEAEISAKELTRQIDYFLDTLDAESRILFVRRYWYAYSISELAKQFGLKSNTVSVRLSRIRDKLRDYLKGEGFTV